MIDAMTPGLHGQLPPRQQVTLGYTGPGPLHFYG